MTGSTLPRYIIHIGLHKTGTSSIQGFLARNRLALLECGVDFPEMGRAPRGSQAHRYIAAYFRNQADEYTTEFASAIGQGLSDAPRCIISCEDFYFFKKTYQMEYLSQLTGAGALVICYLREPVSHLLSMYKERIKGGLTLPLPEMIQSYREAMQNPDSAYSYYSFDRNLRNWETVFQVEAVAYRREGLIADFLGRCGVEWPAAGTVEEEWNNPSVSDAVSLIELAMNRAVASGHLQPEARQVILKQLRRGEQSGQVPDVSQFASQASIDMSEFLEAYRMVNDRYAGLADASPPELNYWDTARLDHAELTLHALQYYFP